MLTHGGAMSYAEDFVALFRHYGLGTITGMRVIRPDGSPYNGRGVRPDHVVQRTIAGVRSGRDEYLDYALRLLAGDGY